MRVLIAPDKFKGSLNARQVCDAVSSAIHKKHPDWSVEKCPLADGGEGTGDLLTAISRGRKVNIKVRDPLFREIESYYGLSPDGETGFIEMASASGLQLLRKGEQNPRFTSSVGTGDLIAHALKNGVKSIVLGCGGSATNDAGIGMACALGFSFLDSNGQALKPIGDNLSKIEIINSAEAMTEIAGCRFIVMSDVNNPLYGLNGAAYTYASQKGASPRDIKLLDDGLKHFSKILKKEQLGTSNFLGAGAAGGFPVSARALLHAEIKSGIDFIIEFAGMAEKVRQADWVITGEGKFDEQSLQGKVISGLARLCLQLNKQLWVVCGVSEVSEKQWRQMGIERVLPISSIAMNMEDAMANADLLIKKELERMLDS